ncbi:MAG: XdhC family protein [Actinomycetota bacterium]|nr:XdhC family protein [Actinomycetota bacterium]
MSEHRLLIVGSGEVASALIAIADTLGWSTTATESLDRVLTALPDTESVIVLSHDPAIDGPALAAAVASRPTYVGAMGSRRTQTRRRDWMLANGTSPAQLAAIHGPAGLDIGAMKPAEIALSVAAEIVASTRRVDASGSLSRRDGPIHPDLAAGLADCPAG